jgi:Kef-type K+ transport system membrane component KefB
LTAGQERPLDRLALVAVFLVSCGALALTLRLLTRFKGLSEVLYRLADTTAQIQVRGAMLLLVVFAALAEAVNLEIILGTFFAGMLVMLTDRRAVGPHVEFRQKLEAIGFGVFVPVFFIVSGVRFDLPALLSSPLAMAQAPVVFLALLVIHGLPAAVYLPFLGGRGTVAAGLLQASSLSFLVAGSQIALGLGALDTATASGLVAGGLLSSVVYPLLALTVLGGAPALLRPTASLTVVPRRLLTQHTKPGEPR